MSRKERRQSHQVDMRTMSLTLTVAVFMALLAFFIVLNSYGSTSHTKVARMREALAGSFELGGLGRSSVPTGEDGTGSAGDAEKAAAEGLRSVLPDVGFSSSRTNDNGRIMVIAVKDSELEERWPALRTRIGDLLSHKGGGAYMLQMLALEGATQANTLVPLANELLEDGVDENLVSVGYETGNRSGIELRLVIAGGK